jgi:leucyl aminopeptidase
MSAPLEIQFVPLTAAPSPTVVALAGEEMALAPAVRALDERTKGGLVRAARAAAFTGKPRTAIEILAPVGIDAQRLLLAGAGRTASEHDRLRLGGYIYAQIAARKTESASLIADLADTGGVGPDTVAADLALGALLRSYAFDKYRTRRNGGNGEEADREARNGLQKLLVHCASPDAAEKAFTSRKAVADGVFLARDLVNEPANVLGPIEFADRLRELASAGLTVDVLDQDQLEALKMNALLGVSQGSVRPPRVVVMQWHGAAKSKRAKSSSKPLCFVGKGVVFDTGGISLKPGAGMEDMKGDMGGAASVAGLMLALAKRNAAVNAVGLVGLVENMPSATAQRPGDIVESMSGQTIEVLNTDAEGRLVLADVLWYAQTEFQPKVIIDLATLTGAIIVALGKEYAGLFANDDKLADELARAGHATGEKVWRMPLDKAYDKMIDSKNADIKNIGGGRSAGSITAAQFIQRFIKDKVLWAHLDIAGTAMDSARNELNPSWASGWGVRLLDRWVADHHEKG